MTRVPLHVCTRTHICARAKLRFSEFTLYLYLVRVTTIHEPSLYRILLSTSASAIFLAAYITACVVAFHRSIRIPLSSRRTVRTFIARESKRPRRRVVSDVRKRSVARWWYRTKGMEKIARGKGRGGGEKKKARGERVREPVKFIRKIIYRDAGILRCERSSSSARSRRRETEWLIFGVARERTLLLPFPRARRERGRERRTEKGVKECLAFDLYAVPEVARMHKHRLAQAGLFSHLS